MVSTHPTQVVNGVKREFLKPESTLHFIPRGRAARGKGTEHTVYRRTLQINKEGFSSDCKKQLEKGELEYNATNLPKSSQNKQSLVATYTAISSDSYKLNLM